MINQNYRPPELITKQNVGIRRYPFNVFPQNRRILHILDSLSGVGSLKLMAKLGVGVLVLTGALSVISAIYQSRKTDLKDTPFIGEKQIENETNKSVTEIKAETSENSFSEQEIFTVQATVNVSSSDQSEIQTTQSVKITESFQDKLITINYTREKINADDILLTEGVGINDTTFSETQLLIDTQDWATTLQKSEQVEITKFKISPVEKSKTDTTLFKKTPEPTLVPMTHFENLTNNKSEATEESTTILTTKSSVVNISKPIKLLKVDQLNDHPKTKSVIYLNEVTQLPLDLIYTYIQTHKIEENLSELEKVESIQKPSVLDNTTFAFTKLNFTDDQEPTKLTESTTDQLRYDTMYLETTETLQKRQTELFSSFSMPTEDRTKSLIVQNHRSEYDKMIINRTKGFTTNSIENTTAQPLFSDTTKPSYSQKDISVTLFTASVDQFFYKNYLNSSLNLSIITDKPKSTDLHSSTDSMVSSTNDFSQTESMFLQVSSVVTNRSIETMQEKSTNLSSLITSTAKKDEFSDKEVMNVTVLRNESIKVPKLFTTEIFNVDFDSLKTQKTTTDLYSDFDIFSDDLNQTQLIPNQVQTQSVEDVEPIRITATSVVSIKHPHFVNSQAKTLKFEEVSVLPKHYADLEVKLLTSPIGLTLESTNYQSKIKNLSNDTPKSNEYITTEDSYTTLDHFGMRTGSTLVNKVQTEEFLFTTTSKAPTYTSFSLTMCNFTSNDKTVGGNGERTNSRNSIKFNSDYACRFFKNISQSVKSNQTSNHFYSFERTSTSKLLSTTYHDNNETEQKKETDIDINTKTNLHKYSLITKENLKLKRKYITKHKQKKLQTKQHVKDYSNVRYIISDKEKRKEFHYVNDDVQKNCSSDEDDEEEKEDENDSDEKNDKSSDDDDDDDDNNDSDDESSNDDSNTDKD